MDGWLLGIYFWREGLEATFGPERRGRKRVGGVDAGLILAAGLGISDDPEVNGGSGR